MATSERATRLGIPGALLAAAAVGWWWSVRMATDMAHPASMHGTHDMEPMAMAGALSLGAFVVAWLAMMTAMMFPAIFPVVKLYGRAAAAGRVAPLPFFVAGYIAVWTAIGVPAFFAWRALADPIAQARPWAARLAGAVLVAAAAWQVTPLKNACLRHCRSPLSVFMRAGPSARHPIVAARLGATHGAYCVGCCWALMAVLVSLGTMNLAWMFALAVLIFVEKNARWGERIVFVAALVMLGIGVALLVEPSVLTAVT